MGSLFKHLRGAVSVFLALTLACSLNPIAAYALPNDASGAPEPFAQASSESEAQDKANAGLGAAKIVDGTKLGEASTSVSVGTYANQIIAELLCVGPDPTNPTVYRYKASTLRQGLSGKPYTFQVLAKGGHGLESLGFKWTYAKVGEAQKDIADSFYLPNEERDGSLLGALDLTAMANASMFEDDASYEFFCTVSSVKANASYTYDDIVLGPAKLDTINGYDYPNKTIYPQGDPTMAKGTEDAPEYVRDSRADEMASVSGAIHKSAVLSQGEVKPTDDAYNRLSTYLAQNPAPTGEMYVMGTPYILAATTDGEVGGAISDGPAETTLPKIWLPVAADTSKGVDVLFIGTDGTVQKLTPSFIDNKYFLVNTGESGVFVLVGRTNKASVKKFAVETNIVPSGVTSDDNEALLGGTIEPANTQAEYVLGSSAVYKFYPDTKEGFDVAEVCVEVLGTKFVYQQGTLTQGTNPKDYGITFGGNFVVFEQESLPCTYKLSVAFKRTTNPEDPKEKASVRAEVIEPKAGGTVSLGGEYGQSANLACNVGDTVTLRLKPASSSWGIESVLVNGKAYIPDGLLLTFKAQKTGSANVNTVTVKFREGAGTPSTEVFTITPFVAGNGEGVCITNDGLPQKVAKTDSATVAFRANPKNHIDYIEDTYTTLDGLTHTKKTQVANRTNESFPQTYSYTLENITTNHTIRAHFTTTYEALPVDVYMAGEGTGKGSVFANGSELSFVGGENHTLKARTGDILTFAFRADASSRLASVKLNGRTITGDILGGTYTLVSEGREYNLEVRFDRAENAQDPVAPVENVKVSYITNVAGSVTPDISTLPRGAAQTFNFQAPYTLSDVRITIDGVTSDNLAAAIIAAGGIYHIDDIAGDVVVRAIWDTSTSAPGKEQVSLKVNVEGPGWADPTSTTLIKGADTSLYLYAQGEAKLSSVRIRGGATLSPTKIAANAWQLNLSLLESDTVIDATFVPGTSETPIADHTITLNVVPEDAARIDKPLGANSVQDGDAFSFCVTPKGKYRIASIESTHNGDLFNIGEYVQTLANITEDRTITVTLSESGTGAPAPDAPDAPAFVSVATEVISGAGVIEPKNPEVRAGSTHVFYFKPAKNLNEVSVKSADGQTLHVLTADELEAAKRGEGYTLQNIQKGALIQARFATSVTPTPDTTYKIALTTSQNGSVVLYDVDAARTLTTEDMATGIKKGTRIEVRATPDQGYKLDRIVVGGISSTTSPYTFVLESDTTVSVQFSKIDTPTPPDFPPPVDPIPDTPGGTVKDPDITIELPEGASITIPAPEGFDPARDVIEWFVSPEGSNWYVLPIDGDTYEANPYVGIVINPDGSLTIPYPNSMEVGSHIFKAVVTPKGPDGNKDPNAPKEEQDYEVIKGGTGDKATMILPAKSVSVVVGKMYTLHLMFPKLLPGIPHFLKALQRHK